MDHTQTPLIVGAQDDVIHISRKTCPHGQSYTHQDECKEAEHGEEVDRTGRLPASKGPLILGEAVHTWKAVVVVFTVIHLSI